MSRITTDRTGLETAARAVLKAGLDAVSPEMSIAGAVGRSGDVISVQGEPYDLGRFEQVYLVAAGKAAAGMGRAMAAILGESLSEGLLVVPGGGGPGPEGMRRMEAAHPLPDRSSVAAAEAVMGLARKAGARDLVFFCLSGGASSLLALPAEGLGLDEKRRVIEALLKAGADIGELNAVRKHISGIKGGRLAAAAHPARLVGLLMSDVVGNDPATIGSGPTAPDHSTYEDAMKVLTERGLSDAVPAAVMDRISRGMRGEIEEGPRPGDEVFSQVRNYIVADNMLALKAAAEEAERMGFRARILTGRQEGQARNEAAAFAVLVGREIGEAGKPGAIPLCLLASGELTVKVGGRGLGGRNTEFMLAMLTGMGDVGPAGAGAEWLAASLGTDGIDGPTDAAGAWIDAGTLDKARSLGLDPRAFLEDNDSYGFFRRTGNLIMTGPTGTNVMDLRLAVIRPASAPRGANKKI